VRRKLAGADDGNRQMVDTLGRFYNVVDLVNRLGHPSIQPPGEPITPGSAIERVDHYCGRCVRPWQIRDVRLELPPWSAAPLGRGARYSCPGCGRLVDMLAQVSPAFPSLRATTAGAARADDAGKALAFTASGGK